MKISRKWFLASWGALFASAGLPVGSAVAADGFININGQLTDQSCQVSVNNGGNDLTLTLPTVSVRSLNQVGATAGSTPFTFTFTGCPTGQGDGIVRTFFEATNVDQTSGNLINTAPGGATNVQVQITDANNQRIVLSGAGIDSNGGRSNDGVPIGTDGTASITYHAQYAATGRATSGAVSTQLVYTIQYQ